MSLEMGVSRRPHLPRVHFAAIGVVWAPREAFIGENRGNWRFVVASRETKTADCARQGGRCVEGHTSLRGLCLWGGLIRAFHINWIYFIHIP